MKIHHHLIWVLQTFSEVRQLGTELRRHHGSHGSFWVVWTQQPMWPKRNLEQSTPQLSLAIRRIVLSPGQAKSSYWGWIKAPRPHKAECWSSLSSFLLLKFAQENAGGFNTVPWSFTSDTVHLHPSYLVPAEIHNSKAVVFSLGLFFPLLRPVFFKYLQIRQSLGAVIIVSFLSRGTICFFSSSVVLSFIMLNDFESYIFHLKVISYYLGGNLKRSVLKENTS